MKQILNTFQALVLFTIAAMLPAMVLEFSKNGNYKNAPYAVNTDQAASIKTGQASDTRCLADSIKCAAYT